MFGKPTLLGAIALSSFAVPAMASAPLAITMPAALPLVAVGASHADCAAYAPQYSSPAMRMTKTEAILGGQPSALEALKQKQQGGGNSILNPTNSILSPAAPAAPVAVSYTPALPVSAIGTACLGTIKGVTRSPVLRSPFPPPARSIGTFLGTERVAIGRTPFDKEWKRVAGRGLSRRDLRRAIGKVPNGREELLSQVNRWVNQSITYRDDIQLNGTEDYWADARETLRRGMGDCEDYAILKMQMLAAAGVDRDDMMLTLLRDNVRRLDHAVLLVRDGADWVMLDLQTDRVVPAAADYGYSPVMSFSDDARWIHGRKRQKPRTIRIAYSN
jgi:predicted transglutaminase-like cysteine proteinase